MIICDIPLKGASIIRSTPSTDDRGSFARFFCEKDLKNLIGVHHIVNVNYSNTIKKGAIRGLHFQYPPKAEMKMVRCIKGSVYDVIVDIRNGSPTFLRWYGIILSAKNMKMMFIPEGFAHGFQVLTPNSEMLYLHTEFYAPDLESGLRYNDPLLDITWPLEQTDISEKDRRYPLINKEYSGVTV